MHLDRKIVLALKRLAVPVSLVTSILSILIAMSVYLENRRRGNLEVFPPSRYGLLRGVHHSNTSDKILLCFTLLNDGNVFRNVDSINLILKSESGDSWHFRAVGMLDKIRCSILKKGNGLLSDPNYFLVSSISVDKKQFITLNLLFFYSNDKGWIQLGDIFKFREGVYEARIIACSQSSGRGGCRFERYQSSRFKFRIDYLPPENLLDTFTNIVITIE
jgi:hypothetical protein